MTSLGELIDRLQAGLEDIGLLAEDVDDEWTFTTDLVAAQTRRFAAIAGRRGADDAPPSAELAIDELLREIHLIDDPHRAIDWLSTFPDLAAMALGEPIGHESS